MKEYSKKCIFRFAPENIPTTAAKTVSKIAPTQNVSNSAPKVCDIVPDTSNVGVDQIDNEIDVNDYEYDLADLSDIDIEIILAPREAIPVVAVEQDVELRKLRKLMVTRYWQKVLVPMF